MITTTGQYKYFTHLHLESKHGLTTLNITSKKVLFEEEIEEWLFKQPTPTLSQRNIQDMCISTFVGPGDMYFRIWMGL